MNFFRTISISCLLLTIQTAFAQQKVKSPDEFLPHHLGEAFTPHYMLTNYFEYLAANSTTTMKLERYGQTNEMRPLQVAYFSSPENLARLEAIRINNLRLAGTTEGLPDLSNPVAIIWISMSVHGNEPSGSEASMELAFRLATQSDAQIREWLKNTVVILDPSLNPDGYDRYTSWNRMSGNLLKNVHPDAREHREPWPGGRPNHYYFDLNRDWAWATQAETRARLQLYHRWLPHVHPDVHEQGINDPYYFAPAAEPLHDYITPWQRDFQIKIGQNNARYFDQKGWLYFTKEIFDLFYPSYGDTYPIYNGSVGMTYEQAGGPRGGRAIMTEIHDTLTLHDRIAHHLTTCLSTIEMTSKNAPALVDNFREYYRRTSTQPQGVYKTFVIRNTNDPNKVETFCQLLQRHQIRFGRAGARSSTKGYDYVSGKETSVTIDENDILISAYQPKSVLTQVLLEPESRLTDSVTYDITAWSLPYAHGLEAYALKERLEPQKPYAPRQVTNSKPTASAYAWCFHRHSLNDMQLVAALLQKGVKVRTATKGFEIGAQAYEPGTLVVNRNDNRQMAEKLDQILYEQATAFQVPLFPVSTGMAEKGNDLGSDAFAAISRPDVAMVYGEDLDANSYGQTWYYFERELGYPVTPVSLDKLHRVHLSDFTTLIFADGSYNLSERQFNIVQEWVKDGGRLIVFDGAVKAFADKDGFALKSKELPKDSLNPTRPFITRERASASEQLPGAIVKTLVDNSHPLAYGLPPYYFSLKTNTNLFQMPTDSDTPLYIGDNLQSYGFIGSKIKSRLKNTPIGVVQSMGSGQVVYFVDNPLFRCFWQQGKLLFANAVFYRD
ncbi:MAG: zinc carboxypeptidase [Bacteroidetes bacterium]|nr:zinc carboxypeptidase [Bacteroidota bacterium]